MREFGDDKPELHENSVTSGDASSGVMSLLGDFRMIALGDCLFPVVFSHDELA